jgi:hypothetical protein
MFGILQLKEQAGSKMERIAIAFDIAVEEDALVYLVRSKANHYECPADRTRHSPLHLFRPRQGQSCNE